MKDRKIRLLLVSSVFGDRGAERLILNLYQFLSRELYEVKVVCLRDLAPYARYLNENTDFKIDIIGMKSNTDLKAVLRFYKYIRDFNPDIINFHHYRAAFWGRPVASLLKVPLIMYSVHNKWGGTLHHFFDRKLAPLTHAIVPFSEAVRDFLITVERIHKKYIAEPIYAGIDISRFTSKDKDRADSLRNELKGLGVSEYSQLIGYIGNITKEKGLVYLIESVKRLNKRANKICCLLIGEGPDEDYLKGLINEYGLSDYFRFLGTRYDIPDLLGIMSIFVLPSLREGLPIVILEALAAGCPVVATNIDGIPEIISHHDNGLLVRPGNVNELASAMETLLTNASLRSKFIENGLSTVKGRFTIQTMIDSYSTLYLNYLNKMT